MIQPWRTSACRDEVWRIAILYTVAYAAMIAVIVWLAA